MAETQENTQTQAGNTLAQFTRDVAQLLPEAREAISKASNSRELDDARVQFLGKKGRLATFNQMMGKFTPEERPQAGKALNSAKQEITALLDARTADLETKELTEKLRKESVDVTLPGIRPSLGARHPIAQVTQEVADIFRSMGFRLESGPEIESEYVNFDALNIPGDHPARDMQDTFYTERGFVLRTHTSPTQIRSMLKLGAPLAVITTGKVYRHDSDATHSPMFHQMEGLLVDRDISFAHLKGILHEFLRTLFGKDVKVRFRPSFFPFTEPSAEVDVWHPARNDWMEVLGSGMVHPNVLRNGGIDPEEFSGFAFGLGMDRLASIKFGIPELRLFFENDVRFLKQF
jgi:phenylalanyl-tRNA synthetase alpha chain